MLLVTSPKRSYIKEGSRQDSVSADEWSVFVSLKSNIFFATAFLYPIHWPQEFFPLWYSCRGVKHTSEFHLQCVELSLHSRYVFMVWRFIQYQGQVSMLAILDVQMKSILFTNFVSHDVHYLLEIFIFKASFFLTQTRSLWCSSWRTQENHSIVITGDEWDFICGTGIVKGPFFTPPPFDNMWVNVDQRGNDSAGKNRRTLWIICPTAN